MLDDLHLIRKVAGLLFALLFASAPGFAAQPLCPTSEADGALQELPYVISQWHAELFADCIVDDANADSSTWELNVADAGVCNLRYRYNKFHRADDFIYLPAVAMRTGKTYEAMVYMRAGSERYYETFSLGIVADTDNSTPSILLSQQQVTSKESTPYKVRFAVECDTSYRLYLHCSSPANHYMLYVDSIAIAECGEGAVPDKVSNMALTCSERAPHIVDIKCNAPTLNVDGSLIEALDKIVIYRNDEPIYVIEQPLPNEEIAYSDSVDVIGEYVYKIEPYCGMLAGNCAQMTIVAGVASFPYEHCFVDGMGYFTIKDNNADGVTWHYYDNRFGGCMRYMSSAEKDADDWLITPPIYLDTTMRYQVEYSCCVGLSHYPESMRVMLGFVPQPQEMSVVVSALDNFTFINDTVIVAPFDVYVPGIYYLAFEACSEVDSYAILLRNISIEEYDTLSQIPVSFSPFKAWGGRECIYISSSQEPQEVCIYNMLGERMNTLSVSTTAQYAISPGVYIVQAGHVAYKVVVR